ncbi:hypothetical protein HYPSUDRAFT_40579 [Hypholoma sublateritium FD-334 SS-4]|uniref:Uncharacterized protein n=1 Tax=Hypholoma sublateritium (strain FD-334 SS-4) TaxID=945553 RepID=A0A0D2L6Z2_HYPSF|nr:hypothetical protein HYPSUDRAFT_40579 [Hypholoma sublateritium FD-334 SS-4]
MSSFTHHEQVVRESSASCVSSADCEYGEAAGKAHGYNALMQQETRRVREECGKSKAIRPNEATWAISVVGAGPGAMSGASERGRRGRCLWHRSSSGLCAWRWPRNPRLNSLSVMSRQAGSAYYRR